MQLQDQFARQRPEIVGWAVGPSPLFCILQREQIRREIWRLEQIVRVHPVDEILDVMRRGNERFSTLHLRA